jgi:large subunit ribosomal protein L21
VYAIVRNGGRQEKVSVGDVIEIDKLGMPAGETLSLPAVMVVDGDDVTTDSKTLAGVDVQVEVVGPTKGPKIHILKYKNKTGYRKRQGHRQHYTQVRVTAINTGQTASKPAAKKTAKKAAKKTAATASASEE